LKYLRNVILFINLDNMAYPL